jgi:hypothetical protein
MNSAAWTAGQALPDQAFSEADPFKMSIYPCNQRISLSRLFNLESPKSLDVDRLEFFGPSGQESLVQEDALAFGQARPAQWHLPTHQD